MENKLYEKGYEDGHGNNEYDNPEEIINPLARLAYLAVGKLEESDTKAEEYEHGYDKGITDYEHNE